MCDGVIYDAMGDGRYVAAFGGTDEEVGSYEVTLLRRVGDEVLVPILGPKAVVIGEVRFQVGSPQGPILESVKAAKDSVEAEWKRRAHLAWQTYLEESVSNLLNLS
jgi:hypothetical protein